MEKLGAADIAPSASAAEPPKKAKALAQLELNQNLDRAHEEKVRIGDEIEAIENELS